MLGAKQFERRQATQETVPAKRILEVAPLKFPSVIGVREKRKELEASPKEKITSLNQLITSELTKSEISKMHTTLTVIDQRTQYFSQKSLNSTVDLLPYFAIIKSDNLDKLDFKGTIDGLDKASRTIKNKCRNFKGTETIETKGKSPSDLLQILYDKCFPSSESKENPTPLRVVVNPSNVLEFKRKESTPEQLLEQRLTQYKQTKIWNGIKPKTTTLEIKELEKEDPKLVEKINKNYQVSAYGDGAEKAFELALKKLNLNEINIQSIHFMPKGSYGDGIGGDFIVVTKSDRQYCFDVKSEGAMNNSETQETSARHENCNIHPIYTNGLIDGKATQQMVLDLVALAESQQ